MTHIGDPDTDNSFNTTMKPRAIAILTEEQIRQRPVWLVRDIAGDHQPPSSSRNQNVVRWYPPDFAEIAGAAFYKIKKGGYGVWDIRLFLWIYEYDYYLEYSTPEEFLQREHGACTPDHVIQQLNLRERWL